MLSGTYYVHNYASIIGGSLAQLLSNIDPFKAMGPDGLPSRLLKELSNELAPC